MPWSKPLMVRGFGPLSANSWHQQEFGDRGALDMAVGPVRGVRWWSMQDDGTLMGAFGGTWGAGENVGYCGKIVSRQRVATFTNWLVSGSPHTLTVNVTEDIDDHPAADPNCVCGYYAFWQPEPLPVHEQYPVVGVIEGYGQTVLGTRGFRCQKARILGLHLARTGWGDHLDMLRTMLLEQRGVGPSSALGRRYGVPVYSSIEALLAEHPPTQDYADLSVDASAAE